MGQFLRGLFASPVEATNERNPNHEDQNPIQRSPESGTTYMALVLNLLEKGQREQEEQVEAEVFSESEGHNQTWQEDTTTDDSSSNNDDSDSRSFSENRGSLSEEEARLWEAALPEEERIKRKEVREGKRKAKAKAKGKRKRTKLDLKELARRREGGIEIREGRRNDVQESKEDATQTQGKKDQQRYQGVQFESSLGKRKEAMEEETMALKKVKRTIFESINEHLGSFESLNLYSHVDPEWLSLGFKNNAWEGVSEGNQVNAIGVKEWSDDRAFFVQQQAQLMQYYEEQRQHCRGGLEQLAAVLLEELETVQEVVKGLPVVDPNQPPKSS